MILIKQRGPRDCCVAAVAMYLDRTYESVVELFITASDGQWKPDMPVNFNTELRALVYVGEPSALVATFNPERPALVSVLSLNVEGDLHSVYWDGNDVYDPSLLKTVDCHAMFSRSVYFTQRLIDLAPLVLAEVLPRSVRKGDPS